MVSPPAADIRRKATEIGSGHPARIEPRRMRNIGVRRRCRDPALLGAYDFVQHFGDTSLVAHFDRRDFEQIRPDRAGYELIELGRPARTLRRARFTKIFG